MISLKKILKEALKNFVDWHSDDVWYHGSRQDNLDSLRTNVPPYEGGIGGGIYLAGDIDHAKIYGNNIYNVRVNLEEDDVFYLTPDSDHVMWIDELTNGHSILVGESIAPFILIIKNQWYGVTNNIEDYNEAIEQEYHDKEIEFIDLEDIGNEVESAGYKAVFFEGFRGGASGPQDELLVFNANDVEIIGKEE
jgi:hypothetical protein